MMLRTGRVKSLNNIVTQGVVFVVMGLTNLCRHYFGYNVMELTICQTIDQVFAIINNARGDVTLILVAVLCDACHVSKLFMYSVPPYVKRVAP
jgi:hypothetical protein